MEYTSPTGRRVNDDHLVANALDQWRTLLDKRTNCQPVYHLRSPGKSVSFKAMYERYARLEAQLVIHRHFVKWLKELPRLTQNPKPAAAESETHAASVLALHCLSRPEHERGLKTYLRELDVFRQNGLL